MLLKSAIFWPEKGHLDRNSFFSTKIMLLQTKNISFCEKLSKFCINRAKKTRHKCDFGDWLQIMFEAVAEAMIG